MSALTWTAFVVVVLLVAGPYVEDVVRRRRARRARMDARIVERFERRGAMSRTTREVEPVAGARAYVLSDLNHTVDHWPAGRDQNRGAA